MVSFVIVSHSEKLALGVIDLVRMMAKNVLIEAAGGNDDGTYGTSYAKIDNAIKKVYSDDGVIVLCDMGSSIMTSEMVISNYPSDKVKLVDCSLVEGAVSGTVSSECGKTLNEIVNELQNE